MSGADVRDFALGTVIGVPVGLLAIYLWCCIYDLTVATTKRAVRRVRRAHQTERNDG